MSELAQAVGRFNRQHEPRREVISGWMADPTGYGDPIVRDEITGDPTGYYYCMIDRGDGTNSGDVIRCWGGGIRPVAGWPVLIGTTRERPWELSILKIDKEAMGGGIDKYAHETEPHHETHEWGDPSGSDDVVYPRWLQLYDFSVWAVPGTRAVTVSDGVYDPSGTKVEFPYTTLDLTEHTPSGTGTSRWVIVCLDPTGIVQTYACPSGTNLTIEDICSVPYADWWELAAIKLWQDDDSINMIPGAEEIIDLRFARVGFPQHGGLGSGTNWENVYIVAKSGGDYTSLVSAEADAPAGQHLNLVMPGNYYENLVISTLFLGFEGMGNRYRDFHVKFMGADDVGPIVTMAEDCALIDIDVERTLGGGAGTFYYVDAAASGKYPKITDSRILANDGGTGRTVVALKASGSGSVPAIINRTYIEIEAGSGLAVELTGGTVLLENCEIVGDIEATAGTTLILRNCFVTGDVTGMAGSDLYLDLGTYVSGSTGSWDSTTTRPAAGGAIADHDHEGGAGSGGTLDHGLALTGLADDDHAQYLLNWDNVLIVNPVGTTRAGQYYATITAALAAASVGDLILIMEGIYSEDLAIATAGLTLLGINREGVIIDGAGGAGTILITAANVTLENLTVSPSVALPALITVTFGAGSTSGGILRDVTITSYTSAGSAVGMTSQHASVDLFNCDVTATGSVGGIGVYGLTPGVTLNLFGGVYTGSTTSDIIKVQGTINLAYAQYGTQAGCTLVDSQEILASLLPVASANPGASEESLKSTSDGYLRLERLGLGADPTAPVHIEGAGVGSGIKLVRGTLTSQWYGADGGPAYFGTESNDDLYLRANAANVLNVLASGAVGIGTITAPHGGVGGGLLAIEGANAGMTGPHIQLTTASDNYPLLQILGYTHDSVALVFDGYFDGAAWKSSDAGSSFAIHKAGDKFYIGRWDVAAAGADISWGNAIVVDSTGKIGLNEASPSYSLHQTDTSNTVNVGYRLAKSFGTNALGMHGIYLTVDGTSSAAAYGMRIASVSGGATNLNFGLYIDSGADTYQYFEGRVGINQANPAHTLEVNQYITDFAKAAVKITQLDVDQSYIWFNGATIHTGKTGQDQYIQVQTASGVRFIRMYA